MTCYCSQKLISVVTQDLYKSKSIYNLPRRAKEGDDEAICLAEKPLSVNDYWERGVIFFNGAAPQCSSKDIPPSSNGQC